MSICDVLALNSTNQLPSYLKSNLDKLFHNDSESTHYICIDWSQFTDYHTTEKEYTIMISKEPVYAISMEKINMM